MFCTTCGAQIADGATFCTQCGKPTGTPPVYQQNMPMQQPIVPKTKWETPRLVIGIITIVLFFLLQFQSCVAGVGESLQSIFFDEAGTSGLTGYLVSFFFLIAGIVSIACRKSKGGAIAAGIIYAICGISTINKDFSYFQDLAFYCFISFAFAVVMIIGGIVQKSYAQ
jgi:hypothetical protein